MNFLSWINVLLCAALTLCYSYQFIFFIISYCKRQPTFEEKQGMRVAVLIAARNEEKVLPRLIAALRDQHAEGISTEIFVTADNCTDSTAEVARTLGATVFERKSSDRIGKGYALDFMIRRIKEQRGEDAFDCFLVFDADNIPCSDFIAKECAVIAAGYDCVAGYRAPMNYSANLLSAGQGMCFLRDMVLLNRARMLTKGCCFVSGTGFMFSSALAKRFDFTWPFHTLTEDAEFTVYCAINGIKVGYSDSAVFFDEQATSHRQCWNQRLRWCKGAVQIFSLYFGRILGNVFTKRGLACFDMAMCMAPAYLISVGAVFINAVGILVTALTGGDVLFNLALLGIGIGFMYCLLLSFSIALTVSEWRMLGSCGFKKILYAFTFPFYMMSYVPVAAVALFKKNVKWTPIHHSAEGQE